MTGTDNLKGQQIFGIQQRHSNMIQFFFVITVWNLPIIYV